MNERSEDAGRAALLELCRAGSPVVHDESIDEILTVAWRRWRSFKRRNAKRPDDLASRSEDLAKGLRDAFEAEPKLAGPLIEDYRFVAQKLAAAFSFGA